MAVSRTILRSLGQSVEGFDSFLAAALIEPYTTQAPGEGALCQGEAR